MTLPDRAAHPVDPTTPSAPGKTPGDRAPCPGRTTISRRGLGSSDMGDISDKLIKRLAKNRKLTGELRREAGSIQAALDALKQGATARLSHGVALDPLHAVYVAVQNVTSGFAERVSQFPEFKPYYQLAAKAEDEYMPGGPPMSPLTRSYFTTWAFFDLRFGPDGETIGTCLLDVAGPLDLEKEVTEAVRLMSETR